jgi:hypothetical protein
MPTPLCRNTGTYSEARAGGQLFSCGAFEISRFVISGRPLRGLGYVPKLSCEHYYLDKDCKGRKDAPGSESKPEAFATPTSTVYVAFVAPCGPWQAALCRACKLGPWAPC